MSRLGKARSTVFMDDCYTALGPQTGLGCRFSRFGVSLRERAFLRLGVMLCITSHGMVKSQATLVVMQMLNYAHRLDISLTVKCCSPADVCSAIMSGS